MIFQISPYDQCQIIWWRTVQHYLFSTDLVTGFIGNRRPILTGYAVTFGGKYALCLRPKPDQTPPDEGMRTALQAGAC